MTRVENRLASILAQRQWTHVQLAEATDIPYAVVRRLVQPATDPPLQYALRISEALRTPIESLFLLADRGAA